MKRQLAKNMPALSALAVLLVAAAAVSVYVLAHQRLRFPLVQQRPFELKAEFATAQAITPGQGQTVRVSGVRVGDISGVQLKAGAALVVMSIEHKYRHLIHTD